MTSTGHHAPGLTGPVEHAPDLPAPANRIAIRLAVRALAEAADGAACDLLAGIWPGRDDRRNGCGPAQRRVRPPGHLASVMAGVAVAAGLGYPLSAPRQRPPDDTVHTASRSSQ